MLTMTYKGIGITIEPDIHSGYHATFELGMVTHSTDPKLALEAFESSKTVNAYGRTVEDVIETAKCVIDDDLMRGGL